MNKSIRTIVHDGFEIGIFIKAFDGVLQTIGALFIFFLKPTTLANWIRIITEQELISDPKDRISHYLINFAQHYSTHTQLFAAIYLLSHGIVKIFLVLNLWQKKLWAYPTAIIIFGLFGIYQTYRFIIGHSLAMLALTVLDVAVIILTWLEYQSLKDVKYNHG